MRPGAPPRRALEHDAVARDTLPDRLARRLVPPLVAAYVRLVRRTTRWERVGEDAWRACTQADRPFLLTMWHSRLLMVPVLKAEVREPITAIVSEHRDGAFIADVLGRFDIGAARGSAADPRKPHKTKGGAGALRGLLAAMRGGANAAVTPDGPRGPRQRCQPGIAQLARLAGRPVLPVAWATERALALRSWDRFVIPLPFGRGIYVFGAPVAVAGKGEASLEAGRLAVEAALNAVTARADAAVGRAPILPAPTAAPRSAPAAG